MTSQEKQALIAALLEEKRSATNKGLDGRVAAIDKELARLGNTGRTPAERGTRR